MKLARTPMLQAVCKAAEGTAVWPAWYRAAEPSGTLIASVFLIASATDYVDGYIARKMVSHCRLASCKLLRATVVSLLQFAVRLVYAVRDHKLLTAPAFWRTEG